MPNQAPPNHVFGGVLTPKLYFLSSRPSKGTSLRRNTRFEFSLVVIGPTVWSGRDAKSTKKKEPKVSKNSPFSQTLFPSSHINQIWHAGSYLGCLSWFWVSERSAEKCGSRGVQFFGFPIDLAHRLLLLPHKPWLYHCASFLFYSLITVAISILLTKLKGFILTYVYAQSYSRA